MKITIIFMILLSASGLILVNCIRNDDMGYTLVNLPKLGGLKGSIGKTAWTNQNIIQFLGIPYAESPSKERRFKPPIPKLPWKNLRDASRYGRECPDISRIRKLSFAQLKEDLEDCLNLCVYTKDLTARQPVMLYVHGGGFYNGSAKDHPPNYLLEKDIVLVVVQYRFGPLGFLSTQTSEIPGNVAVLDVILALQWIQENIKYFGGDPTKVTVFGQSAGAAITSLLTISPKVPKGLFNRAIVQSGSILADWATNYKNFDIASHICMKAGCKDCSCTESINQCLIRLPVAKLVEASSDSSFSLTVSDFNGILPMTPKTLMANLTNKYQIMSGATRHDGSYVLTVFWDHFGSLVGDFSQVKARDIIPQLIELLSGGDNSGALQNFIIKSMFRREDLNRDGSKELIPNFIDLATSLAFKSPLLHYTQLITKDSTMENYLYTFDYQGQYTRFGYEEGNDQYPFNGGSHHSDDNLYLFPYPYDNLNENDTRIAEMMVDIWTSFAANGKPHFLQSDTKILPIQNGDTGPFFHIDRKLSIGDDYLDEFNTSENDPNAKNLIR